MLISNFHGYNIYIWYLVIILISHHYTLIILLLWINSKIYFYKVNRIKKLSYNYILCRFKRYPSSFFKFLLVKALLFDCKESEGDLKDTLRITKNAAFNVDLFKISFVCSCLYELRAVIY